MITKESVRINLKGVSSVMIDPEVLAEYKTTIENLEEKLGQAEFNMECQIGAFRQAEYWRCVSEAKVKEEQAKNINHERWRQSL